MPDNRETIINALGKIGDEFKPKLDQVAELKAQIDALMEFQGLTVKRVGTCVYEVVKAAAENMPKGDYLNPYPFITGMTVVKGMFYEHDGLILECVKSGTALKFGGSHFEQI